MHEFHIPVDALRPEDNRIRRWPLIYSYQLTYHEKKFFSAITVVTSRPVM